MSSEQTGPSSAGEVGPPPQGSGTGLPNAPVPGRKRPALVLTAIAVIVVVLVLVAAYEGLIPGVHLPGGKGSAGSGPLRNVPYSTAKAAAVNAATADRPGSWDVVGATAVNSVQDVSLSALALSSASILGCSFSASTSAPALFVSAVGGPVGQGSSPFWLFVLRNSSSTGMVVLVLNGTAEIAGTLAGAGCGGGLGLFADVPAMILDSSAAVSTANTAGGWTFLVAHPLANASIGILGGVSAFGATISPDWVITYYDCSIGAPVGASVGTFDAIVDATTGSVVYSGATTTTCPTLLGGFGGAVSAPLSGALSVGSSGPATCTAPGSDQTCTYVFPIGSAAPGLLAADLTFSVQNSVGVNEATRVANLSLLDPAGCIVGTFTFSTGLSGGWTPGAHSCGSASLTGPLTATETLSLQTAPSPSPSLGGQGYRLVVRALLGYTGSVTAAIT